jgi:type IV pilus assembly protein PilF
MMKCLRKFRFLPLLVLLGVAGQASAQYDFAPSPQPQQMGGAGDTTISVSDPRSRAKIHTELGALYFQAGSPAAALEHLAMALQIEPRFHQANSVRGLVYASLREYAKAEADFARALALAPNDPEVNNNYGWFLCETGKEKQSIQHFDRALRDPLYETPDRAYTNAGSCLLKAGDLDQAQNYLLQAVRISRSGAVQARLGLARVFYLRGNLEESKLYLNDALRMMEPPTPDALWLGVRLERKLGDKRAENGFASQLRSRYPTSSEYQEFLKGNFE